MIWDSRICNACFPLSDLETTLWSMTCPKLGLFIICLIRSIVWVFGRKTTSQSLTKILVTVKINEDGESWTLTGEVLPQLRGFQIKLVGSVSIHTFDEYLELPQIFC